MNMLHEIQPGDVVIVTVAAAKYDDAMLKEMCTTIHKCGVVGYMLIGGTETSVHVIRAKVEGKPSGQATPDNWPAWRDVSNGLPNEGERVLCRARSKELHGKDQIYVAIRLGMDWYLPPDPMKATKPTHWMPLPEGP